jgi:serine/threonine protein kinase
MSEEKNHRNRISVPPPLMFEKGVNWDSFDILGRVGKGGFGEVFVAELKTRKQEQRYAIKRMRKALIHKNRLCEGLKL